MWRFEHLSQALPDAERFLTVLNAQGDFFDVHAPLYVGRAPGRLDLMGGIADYSGSLVLELPLGVATWVAIQAMDEPLVTLYSTGIEAGSGASLVSLPLASLQLDNDAQDYSAIHAQLTADPERAWIAYVLGVLVLLQRERGLLLDRGLRLFVYSAVPAGKGVSSSAALEVATMQAVNTLFDLQIGGREMAILCQRVENLIVGAPCGIMDQMTSACGTQDTLLALLCQPAELQ